MSTSVIGTVLDAIRAALVVRAGLSGVNVFSGPVSLEEAGQECIAFGDMNLTDEQFAMGGDKQETWTVKGAIRVAKAWQGTTETTIKAARDRALAIFAQVEIHINDTYGKTYPDTEVTSGDMVQDYNTEGRICVQLFELTVTAVKNP